MAISNKAECDIDRKNNLVIYSDESMEEQNGYESEGDYEDLNDEYDGYDGYESENSDNEEHQIEREEMTDDDRRELSVKQYCMESERNFEQMLFDAEQIYQNMLRDADKVKVPVTTKVPIVNPDKENIKWAELYAWTESLGITIQNIPGKTIDEKYLEMKKHKANEEILLEQIYAHKTEKNPEKAKEKVIEKYHAKPVGMNEKGKLQGTKTQVKKIKPIKVLIPIVAKIDQEYLNMEDIEEDNEEDVEDRKETEEIIPKISLPLLQRIPKKPVEYVEKIDFHAVKETVQILEKPEVEWTDEDDDEEMNFIKVVDWKEVKKYEKELAKNIENDINFVDNGVIGTGWDIVGSKKAEKKSVEKAVKAIKAVKVETKIDREVRSEIRSKVYMCKTVMEGRKCNYGAKCNFAHSINELNKSMCKFATNCLLVKRIGKDTYANMPSKTGKTCHHFHPSETDLSYGIRMEIPKSCISPPIKIKMEPCQCKQGYKCPLTEPLSNGLYRNKNKLNVCMDMHPRETPQSYQGRTTR